MHVFLLIPLSDGREVACWLDPFDQVVVGCSCGWRGPALELWPDETHHFYGEMSLDDLDFDRLTRAYDIRHADALVPAVADLPDSTALASTYAALAT
jgi:hypothetical protein